MASIVFTNISWLYLLVPTAFIPLTIHLLNKKSARTVHFPSLSLLRQSTAQRSKLMRFRHLIFMALRTLALIFLIFCFLNPVLNSYNSELGDNKHRSVFLILDHSLSMNYKGDGVSSSEKALIEVQKIINTLESKDQVNLLVAHEQSLWCFDKASENHQEVLAFAQSLSKSLSTSNLRGALDSLENQLSQNSGRKEVYFLSDFQRSEWGKAQLEVFRKQARLFFIDVSAKHQNNRAIVDMKIQNPKVLVGQNLDLKVKLANYSDQELSDQIELLLNAKESFIQEVSVGPWSQKEFSFSLPVRSTGLHSLTAAIKPDALEEDNEYHLSFKALKKEEVVVISDEESHDQYSSTFYLKAALDPFKQEQGFILAKSIRSQELNNIHLASSKKVFMSSVDTLSDKTVAILNEFVNKGGSLLYFLDGKNDAQNLKLWNEKLAVRPAIELGPKQLSKNIPGAHIKIRSGDFDSPLLKLFHGESRKQLSQLDFYQYYHARASGEGQILLSYSDGTPAMSRSYVGAGQMILCNFSVSELGSNLASQNVFPAWIQELASQMDPDLGETVNYQVEKAIDLELWLDDMKGNNIIGPDKLAVKTDYSDIKDERIFISFRPQQTGLYQLIKDQELLQNLAVNINSDESDLRKVDVDLLAKRNQVDIHQVSGQEAYREIKQGKFIFHWFLLAALGFVLLELLLIKYLQRGKLA